MNLKKVILIVVPIFVIIIGALIILKSNNKYDYEVDKITEYNYLIYKENESYGVINNEGNVIVNATYDDIIIPNPGEAIFACYEGENVKILNQSGQEMFTEYENVEPVRLKNIASPLAYEKSVLKYKKDGLYGLIDFKGNIITKNEYDSIENLQPAEGKFLVKKGDKKGIIDLKGNILVDVQYDEITSDGYYTEEYGYTKSGFIVSNKTNEGYRYGYINKNSKQILPIKYNEIDRITDIKDDDNIYLITSENGKYGLFKNSKQVIDNEYQNLTYDDNAKLIIIQKNTEYGMATLKGDIVIPVENTELESQGIYIYTKKNSETNVYDREGKKVDISFYKYIYETENENYRISTILNNDITYYGIVDINGNTLVEEKYRYIEHLYNNYFMVKNEEDKLGIIDNNGKILLNLEYDSLQKLTGKNVIRCSKNEKNVIELYSQNLEKIYTLTSNEIYNEEDYILINDNDEEIYLDENGNKIEDTSKIKKSNFPKNAGDYKKFQESLETIYYIKE